MPGTSLPPEILKTMFSYQEQWRLMNKSRLVFIGKIAQFSRRILQRCPSYFCVELPIRIVNGGEISPYHSRFLKQYVLMYNTFIPNFTIQHQFGYYRGWGIEMYSFRSKDRATWVMDNYEAFNPYD
jgi:hypothetical protein